MSDSRLAAVLEAAYRCFTRHGVRRTTMDDIAAEAGMSRPALYQHVKNKDDAFVRLVEQMFAQGLDQARQAAAVSGDPADRLTAIFETKLDLQLRIAADSPHHAAELLASGSQIAGGLDAAYRAGMRALILDILGPGRTEEADVLLAFVRGLEVDLSDPDTARSRLRRGIALFTAGLRTH